jgi:hypothetical protein
VEAGTVAVVDGGYARQPAGRPGLDPGESVLVEQDRLVKLENPGREAGSVLVLGILPPEGQLPIGPFGEPANIWIPFSEEQEHLTHRQMLSGDVGALARADTRLFAACLQWTDPTAEIVPARYPGPVGLVVLRGQLVVNEATRLDAGMCWLSAGFEILDLRAGDQPPAVVLFGALPIAAQPRLADGASDPASPALACAGPTTADRA